MSSTADDEAASTCISAPSIDTKITNPGIADRLEKDVIGFGPYGFSFDATTKIFRAPPPASCHSPAPDDHRQHLWVTIPKPGLVASVGPFLRTLVRMSDGVDPRTLRVVVSFCWGKDAAAGNDDDVDVDDDGGIASAAAAAARIAHHVHMIVRNSMSAALFLTSLSILLPTSVSVGQVMDAMRENEDVNYPTIALLERVGDNNCDRILLDGNHLDDVKEGRPSPPVCIDDYVSYGDANGGGVSARILVQTRMCTVRLTPVLYHLATALRQEYNETTREDIKSEAQGKDQSMPLPLILACVDKVANLFRIIMLARDYKAQHRLIVVVRDERIRTRLKAEMAKFIAGLDPLDNCGDGAPRVETIDVTVALLEKECSGKIVAVDLHPDALTLDETNDDALLALRSAGAVIWGFEKDGIPDTIDNMAQCYVQVRCRSSLNLVAAMSVVLHRGWSNDIMSQ